MWFFSGSNVAVVAAKREQRATAIAQVNLNSAIHDVTSDQAIIIRATASEIVSSIKTGKWTASQVLEAFIARAVLAHAKTNCLTEVFFDSARQRAKELDEHFAANKELKGPLHGVPVSIKEQFEIRGVDTSVGFSQWANEPAESNADIVEQLLAAGAVLYVKTNIPQTMFAFECSNPVWGRTTNPYNDKYTCGGSSGGEAALLAMDGSALGIGTDIGGSLRIPAAYCGVFSLKPASGRISYGGARGPVPGFDGIKSVAGPMGRSVKDLELLSKVAFGLPSRSHDVAPLPFRDITLSSNLRFGYYTHDSFIKASPACQRAVLESVDSLRKQGHECIEIAIPDAAAACNIFVGLTSADGYKTMLSHLGPDPKEKSLFLVTLGPKLNFILRDIAAWIVETFLHDKIFADALRAAKNKTVREYWALAAERDRFVKNFDEEVWDKFEIDGIIAPVQALPQLPHGGCNNFSALALATILYNILDIPVGCLPVTRVDPTKDQLSQEWIDGLGHGSKLFESGIFTNNKPLYDPEAMKGMPVNIQIVGRKWEEEKVLAMMDIVDLALGKERGFGPGAWDKYMKASKV